MKPGLLKGIAIGLPLGLLCWAVIAWGIVSLGAYW